MFSGQYPQDDDNQQEVEVRFTIYENQRWWMGLDVSVRYQSQNVNKQLSLWRTQWTPNLLPHERGNWTDATHTAVVSPSNFQLPDSTTIIARDGKSRRKIEWRWIEGDWEVCKASPGFTTPQPSHAAGSAGAPPKPRSIAPRLRSTSVLNPIKSIFSAATPPKPPRRIFSSSTKAVGSIDSSSTTPDQLLGREEDDLEFDRGPIANRSLVSGGLFAHLVEGADHQVPWDVDTNGLFRTLAAVDRRSLRKLGQFVPRLAVR